MIEIENKEELDALLDNEKEILVLFYASWCPYCTSFVPVFDRKLANFNSGKVIHVLLDDFDNPLWDDYDVEAVPTVIFFENGKVSKRLDGRSGVGLSEKQLNIWLEQFET